VVQGSTTAPYTVTISRTGGFAGAVTFSTSALPAGATATFNPNPASGTSSSLTIQTTLSTAPGTYPFTITGVSGALTRTTSATLIVTSSSGDFTLGVTPSSQTVTAGMPTSYNVSITRNGFTGSVTLGATGLPAGANAVFVPNPTTGTSSTMNVTTSTSTPTGTYPLTITATSTLPQHTAPATLVVLPCDGDCP
jgi:serine protease AprX